MSQNSEARRTIGDKSKTGYRGPIAEYGVTDMMDFRRWVRRTTPLVLTGALVAAGLTGCQSAQNLLPGDSALGPDQSLESVPQAPALPYEDIPQLPAPAPGVDTAATKSGPGVTPSPPEPNFEPNVDTEVEVAKPATNSTTEKVDAPVTTVEVKPTETPATATPETQPDAVASESATSDPETKPIEPVFEEPSFEKEEPVASTSDPVEKPSTATTAAPTLPLGPDLKQPSETTDPLTLPPDAGEEPLPIPKSTAPRLPNTLPRELPTEEPTPSESAPAKTTPAVTKPVTLPKKATPESLLPKEKPVGKLPVKTKPVEKLTVETEPAETKPTEPPTPADKSIPFSESGEATVPKPTGRDDKPATEPSPDESLELPENRYPLPSSDPNM